MSVRQRTWRTAMGGLEKAWEVDVVFEHPTGRVERVRKRSPVNTRAGAERYEREVRAALQEGTRGVIQEVKTVPTLSEFEERFLTDAQTNNKTSTIKSKRDILRKHLVPHFGTWRLDQINDEAITKYKGQKLAEGQSRKSVNNHLAVLFRLLALAKKWGDLVSIPDMELLRLPDPETDFLTFEEAERFVQAAKGDGQWEAMIVVALNTGLRLGELCALRWDSVDLKGGRIVVRHNLVRGEIGTPKSGRSREVPLNRKASEALKAQRAARVGPPYVFCNEEGGLWSSYNAPTQAISRISTRAKLGRPVGWHMLRHTFASHLVMRGVSLKAVQELLGHSSLEMTMRYAHLAPAVKKDAVAMLDGDSGTSIRRNTADTASESPATSST
jgi:integrase